MNFIKFASTPVIFSNGTDTQSQEIECARTHRELSEVETSLVGGGGGNEGTK